MMGSGTFAFRGDDAQGEILMSRNFEEKGSVVVERIPEDSNVSSPDTTRIQKLRTLEQSNATILESLQEHPGSVWMILHQTAQEKYSSADKCDIDLSLLIKCEKGTIPQRIAKRSALFTLPGGSKTARLLRGQSAGYSGEGHILLLALWDVVGINEEGRQ